MISKSHEEYFQAGVCFLSHTKSDDTSVMYKHKFQQKECEAQKEYDEIPTFYLLPHLQILWV